jgi:hypothetical protein
MFGKINKLVVGIDVTFEHGYFFLSFFIHEIFSKFSKFIILI